MYANDYKDIGALKELADKYGICILLVHHLRKQSSSDPYEQISGSTGIMGVADTTWLMHAKTRLNESAQLVTGIHCRVNHAWEDMRAVQERFGKTDGVVALHAYQRESIREVSRRLAQHAVRHPVGGCGRGLFDPQSRMEMLQAERAEERTPCGR